MLKDGRFFRDKRKGIILAVVLFLLIGLGTFVFADEPEDPGNNTGETDSPNGTTNDGNGSTTNPDDEGEVQDDNSGTDDEGTTATNRRPSNSGSTEVIIGGGTGEDTPSTDNPSSDNGSNAGEGEENPGEVTEEPDTTAPVITINGESYQGKGNNIGYVNGDVILSLAEENLEVVVAKDGEELSFEDGMTLSLDGKYVITVTDEAGNVTSVELIIDQTLTFKTLGITNITHYNENKNDAGRNLSIANIGDTLRIMVQFDELLATAPTVTIGNVSKEMHFDEAWADYYYWADITLTEEMNLEDGTIPFTITDYTDEADNSGVQLTEENINHSTYKAVVLDSTAPVLNFGNGKIVSEFTVESTDDNFDYMLIKYYDGREDEIIKENTFVISGDGDNTRYNITVYDKAGNTSEYRDIYLDNQKPVITGTGLNPNESELEDGGEYQSVSLNISDGSLKKVVRVNEDGTETELATFEDNYKNIKVVYEKTFEEEGTYTIKAVDRNNNEASITFTIDRTAPSRSAANILVQGDSNEQGTYYATYGDTIYAYVSFNDELAVAPTIEFVVDGKAFAATTKREETPNKDGKYIYYAYYEITEDTDMPDGEVTMKVTNIKDKAGNTYADITEPTNGHVVYKDTTKPAKAWLYVLNVSDEDNRQVIGNGQTLRVELNVDEKLDDSSLPVLTLKNGQTATFRYREEENADRYIYVADIKIDNTSGKLTHNEIIEFTVSNIKDLAGNKLEYLTNADATKTNSYDQVTYDGEAPEIVSLLINSANNIDYHYANENHNIGIYLTVNEKLEGNPTFKLNGQECATNYQTEEVSSGYKYAVLCKLPEDAEQGEVEFEITNVTDIVGNTITEPITNEAIITDTDKTYVVFDSVDPDIEMQTHGEGQSYKNWNTVTVEIIEENLHEVYYKWGNTSSYTPVDLDEIKKTEDGKYQLTVPVSKDGRVRLYVKVVDKVGHEKEERGYFNIDTTVPTATVEYSTTDWTNGNVVATIKPSEAVTITNNGGSNTYTFTENGEFTFEFVDKAQNVGSVTATVNNIDKEAKGVTFSSNGGSRVDNKFDVEVTVLEENVEEVVYLFTTSGNSENIKKYGFNQSGVKVEELVDGKFVATLEGKSSGKYTLWVKVTDKAGNVSYTKTSNKFSLDSEVEVVLFKTNSNNANDQTLAKAGDWVGVYLQVGEKLAQLPTFTINGQEMKVSEIEWNGTYTYQAGFTVTSDMDGRVSFNISNIVDQVGNNLALSSDECDYSVTIDNNAPTIVLAGTEGLNHNEFRIEAGTKISIDDILATVEDNVDEDTKIEPYDVTLFPVNGENVYHYDFKQNGFNTRLTGRYNLYYKTTDKAGNSAEAVMLLVINDTTPATLTFNREDGYTVDVGSNYEELGATVTDNVDETIVIMPRIYVKYDLAMNPLHETVSKIDTNEEGRYLAIFDYTDSSNNVSLTLKRWIVVRDISE